MKIDRELVEKLAGLSRIQLQDDEMKKMIRDLNKILSLVDKLNELDTSEIAPLIHMTEEISSPRADIIDQAESKEDILKNAPVKNEDFIKVPKVVRK